MCGVCIFYKDQNYLNHIFEKKLFFFFFFVIFNFAYSLMEAFHISGLVLNEKSRSRGKNTNCLTTSPENQQILN